MFNFVYENVKKACAKCLQGNEPNHNPVSTVIFILYYDFNCLCFEWM